MTKKKQETESKSQPMDPNTREVLIGTPQVNRQRVCWAAKQLVSEVEALFPETPVEYSNYNGRNTALDVTFDLTALDREESELLSSLLTISESETRVQEVVVDYDTQSILVSFKPNATTQDDRASFGLADTLLVLNEDDDQ